MMCLKLLHQKLMSNQKRYRLEMDIPCKEVFSLDTEGFIDLADEEVRNDQHSTLRSSMCQALARFLAICCLTLVMFCMHAVYSPF